MEREEGRRKKDGREGEKKVRKGNPKQSAAVPGTVQPVLRRWRACCCACCAAVLRLSVATHSLELALIDC